MSYINCYILKSFLFSEDGYTEIAAPKGETVDIPEKLFPGLNDARMVRRAKIGDGHVSLAPSNTPAPVEVLAGTTADANNGSSRVVVADELPLVKGVVEELGSQPAPQPAAKTAPLGDSEEAALADGSWKDMKFFAKRSLAAKLSTDPIKNGEDADAAIEAELKRRSGE